MSSECERKSIKVFFFEGQEGRRRNRKNWLKIALGILEVRIWSKMFINIFFLFEKVCVLIIKFANIFNKIKMMREDWPWGNSSQVYNQIFQFFWMNKFSEYFQLFFLHNFHQSYINKGHDHVNSSYKNEMKCCFFWFHAKSVGCQWWGHRDMGINLHTSSFNFEFEFQNKQIFHIKMPARTTKSFWDFCRWQPASFYVFLYFLIKREILPPQHSLKIYGSNKFCRWSNESRVGGGAGRLFGESMEQMITSEEWMYVRRGIR